MIQPLKIGFYTAQSGERVQKMMPITDTNAAIPLTLINGAHDGPLFLITAGIHGSEYTGILAAMQLGESIDPMQVHGAVVIVSIANFPGFTRRRSSRVPSDGGDLNRAFPGDADGTETERMARFITDNLLDIADFHVDLHAGSLHETLLPHVYIPYACSPDTYESSRQLSEAVNVPYAVRSMSTQNAMAVLAQHNKPSLLLERGQLGLWTQQDVDLMAADVTNLLRASGVLSGEASFDHPKPIVVEDAAFLESTADGLWYPAYAVGDIVKAGAPLGTIRDWFNRPLEQYTAPFDGVILFQVASLAAVRGEVFLGIGRLETGE